MVFPLVPITAMIPHRTFFAMEGRIFGSISPAAYPGMVLPSLLVSPRISILILFAHRIASFSRSLMIYGLSFPAMISDYNNSFSRLSEDNIISQVQLTFNITTLKIFIPGFADIFALSRDRIFPVEEQSGQVRRGSLNPSLMRDLNGLLRRVRSL